MERLTERKWTTEDNTQPTVVLETCAHCGGVADFLYKANSTQVKVGCRTCHMSTEFLELKTRAVAAWNRRIK
jgi:hypothetical protein